MSMQIPRAAILAMHGVIEDYDPSASIKSRAPQKTTLIAQGALSQLPPRNVRSRSFIRGGGMLDPLITANSPHSSPYNTRSKKRTAADAVSTEHTPSETHQADHESPTRQTEKKPKKTESVQTTSTKNTPSRIPMTPDVRDEKLNNSRFEIYSDWIRDLRSRVAELEGNLTTIETNLQQLNSSEKGYAAKKKSMEIRLASCSNLLQDKKKKITWCEQAARGQETPEDFAGDVKSIYQSAWKTLIAFAEKNNISIPCDDSDIYSHFEDEVNRGIIFQETD